jgi:hypothetical protein
VWVLDRCRWIGPRFCCHGHLDSGSKQASTSHTYMIESDVSRSTTGSIHGPTPTKSNTASDLLTQIEQRRIWFDRVCMHRRLIFAFICSLGSYWLVWSKTIVESCSCPTCLFSKSFGLVVRVDLAYWPPNYS